MGIEEVIRRQSVLDKKRDDERRQMNAIFVGDRLKYNLETNSGLLYARSGMVCSVEQKYKVERLVESGQLYVKN